MRVFHSIADRIAALGVRHVFTLMSEETAKLTEELITRDVIVAHARHEHIAIGMADGYARASGGVGVAIVGRGPGLTNGLNALTAAARASSRVLVLTGDSDPVPAASGPGRRTRNLKYVDQAALLGALGVMHVELDAPDTAAAIVGTAFHTAGDSGCVVVVNMPADLLEREAAASAPPPHVSPPPAELGADDLGAIADLLEATWASQRPVIIAGRGAVRAGARDMLVRLGELTGALLGTSAQGKGSFSGLPLDVGVIGTFSPPEASELLVTADLVLAFGASLNQYTTHGGTIFGKARIIHVDRESAALSRYQPVELGVVADAKAAATAIVTELERRGHRGEGFRGNPAAAALAARRDEIASPDRASAAGMDPRSLWIALERALPADRALAMDGGNFMEWVIAHASVPDAGSFFWPTDYGAIGCGLGVALGACVARPDRTTVLAAGDGGLMMALADLDTAVRYRLPLTVVVNNNNALGSELHLLRAQGYPGECARYENPSFELAARGLGLDAATVTSVSQLESLRDWLARPVPKLLDCRINPDVVSPAKVRAGL